MNWGKSKEFLGNINTYQLMRVIGADRLGLFSLGVFMLQNKYTGMTAVSIFSSISPQESNIFPKVYNYI